MSTVIKLAIKKIFLVAGGGRNTHVGFTLNVWGMAILQVFFLAN